MLRCSYNNGDDLDYEHPPFTTHMTSCTADNIERMTLMGFALPLVATVAALARQNRCVLVKSRGRARSAFGRAWHVPPARDTETQLESPRAL